MLSTVSMLSHVLCLVAQSSLDFLPSAWPVACQAPLSMKILQARILEWVAMPSSRVFPTQGLNAGLLHCRWILYHLSHKGSSIILEQVAIPFTEELPDPGIKLGSLALQAYSSPAELPGKLISLTLCQIAFQVLFILICFIYTGIVLTLSMGKLNRKFYEDIINNLGLRL